MKKNKKVGNHTSVNFFITDFKLKSTQLSRDRRQRKSANNANHQRYHNLFHNNRKSQRQSSNSKPQIQQLKFASATSTQFLKMPSSASKRSYSKTNQNQKSRLEKINNQMYQYLKTGGRQNNQTSQLTNHHRLSQVSGFRYKKIKNNSVNSQIQQRLQRTALQRFHQASTTQKDVSYQGATEKKAQALFNYLRQARLRHQQRGQKYRFQQTQHLNDKNAQTAPGFYKHSETSRQTENKPPAPSKQFSQTVPSSSKNIVYQDILSSKQPSLPKNTKKYQEEIHREQQNTKEYRKKSQSSGSQVDFGQIQSSQQDQMESKEIVKKHQPIIPQTQLKRQQQNNSRKKQQENKRQSKRQPVMEKQVKKVNDKPKPIIQTIQKFQQPKEEKSILSSNIIDSLPQVSTISAPKLKDRKQSKQLKQISQQLIKGNNLSKQKISSSQKGQKQTKPPKEQTKPKVLGAPPSLMSATPKSNKKITYQPQNVDDDQLQQIQFQGNKIKQVPKKPEPPKAQHTTNKQLPKKEQSDKNQKNQDKIPIQTNPDKIPNVVDQNVEESQGDALDALIFYIERIEDIGQYRMKSKDLYNDKSISKELIDIYKICSYYMAHQFLYLTKQLHTHLTAPNISKDYFEILAQDLVELRDSGQIQEDLEALQSNLEQSKKLLQKCYKEVKQILPKDQRILLLDGTMNYHLKCCHIILKQFKIIYGFYEKKTASQNIKKRCCYLIEIFCVLKLLSGQQIKQVQEIQDIQNYDQHIKQYKNILLGK